MWQKLVWPILVNIVTTITSLYFLFSFVYDPLVELIRTDWGWYGFVAKPGTIFFLIAVGALFNTVIFFLLFAIAQAQLLRAVLGSLGILDQIRRDHGDKPAFVVKDSLHQFRFLLVRVPLMIVTLPLHLLFPVGTFAWCVINGWLYTWGMTYEFMLLTGRRGWKQWDLVQKHFGLFLSFGGAALLLELIPLLGDWIFFLSNACGAGYVCRLMFYDTHYHDSDGWHSRSVDIEEGVEAHVVSEALTQCAS